MNKDQKYRQRQKEKGLISRSYWATPKEHELLNSFTRSLVEIRSSEDIDIENVFYMLTIKGNPFND